MGPRTAVIGRVISRRLLRESRRAGPVFAGLPRASLRATTVHSSASAAAIGPNIAFSHAIRAAASVHPAFEPGRSAHRTATDSCDGAVNAAHRHAEVFGLDHHDDAAGIERVDEAIGDLACEPFLQLEPARVEVHEPGELREAKNA